MPPLRPSRRGTPPPGRQAGDRLASRRSARSAALLLATLGAATTPLGAQGAVRGTAEVRERSGVSGAGVIVYLQRVDAGAPGAAPDTAAIVMRDKEFVPHVRVVAAGGAVSFPNRDPFSHNVFSNATLGEFDLGLYRRGVSRAATFERAGVYPIYCNVHAKMVAFVVAVPTGYVAQTDAAGRFAIDGVPAGRYVLHAWHERGGETSAPVAVPAAGLDTVRVSLDARAYVDAPHPNKFGGAYPTQRRERY